MVMLFMIIVLLLYFIVKKTSFAEVPITVGVNKSLLSSNTSVYNNFFMSSKKKITEEELKFIHFLKDKNLSSREIAEQLNRPPNVIRYWWNKSIDKLNKVVKKSMMIDYKENVIELIIKGYTRVQIHRILKYDCGFQGSIDTVSRFVNKLKQDLPQPAKKAFFVQLPPPGENLQIDFVEFGIMKDENGKDVKIKVMIFVLPYSRHAYYHHVYTESGEEIFPALAEAFSYFGGVPRNIICDNFKAIVVSNNNRGTIVLTDEAVHFEQFFNTKFVPCHTYSPWEKGVVENAAKYIQHSFIVKNHFGHEDVQKDILEWNNEIAAKRIHGTTKKVPIDEFNLKEQHTLLPLPQEKYFFSQFHSRKVHDKIFLISYGGNKYSVDPKYIGKEVKVHEERDTLVITHGTTTIGRHTKVAGKQKGVIRIDSKHQDAVINKRSIDKDMNLMASFFDLSLASEKIYEQLPEDERKPFMKEILNISDSFGKDLVASVLETALKQNDFTLKNIEFLVNKKTKEDSEKLQKRNRRKYIKDSNIDIDLKPINRDDYDI